MLRIKKEENKILFIEPGEILDEKITLITDATFPALDKLIEHKRRLQFELDWILLLRSLIQEWGLKKIIAQIEEDEELTPAVIGYLVEKMDKMGRLG